MTQTDHSLGGGDSSNKIAAAQADLNNFPTSNIYDGGCAKCACEIPIVLEYEDGAPVPEAEFVVKWGEQEEGEEGETIVTPKTEAQKAAPEIKGVVDQNGLARVKNSPCGSYVVLFSEGSDALDAQSLDETSELHLAIEAASASSGVGSLTPTGRGQLLWWLSYWLKEKAAEHMMGRIKSGDISSKSEVINFFEKHGGPLWTNEQGQVNESEKAEVFQELNNESIAEIAESNYFAQDGALDRLEEALEDKREDMGYPDEPAANKVARSLEQMLVDGRNIPNQRFYQVLQNIGQAERVAAQLFDPNESSGWDVFLLVAEAVLGFIPVVGDVIDVVDIIKWLYKFSDENQESPGTWDFVELGALSLGFIPAVGVLLKKTFAPIARFFAGIRGANKAVGSASNLLQKTIQILRKLGDGNLIQWIVKQKNAVKSSITKLKDVMKGLCETVVAALRKYIQKSWFWNPAKGLAERLQKIFSDFKDSINKYIDPFLNKVDDMVATFIAKIANRFTASAGKEINPTVFKLRRRSADGSGGLGRSGNGQKSPEGSCPLGMKQAMGSNPINMILGQPFVNQIDVGAGLFSLERTWTPNQGGGLFGPLWSTPLSSFVSVGPEGATFQTSMGRKIPFDIPVNGAICANVHDNNYTLIEYGNGYAIKDSNNMLWIYQWHDGTARRLSSVRDSNDQGFDIHYAPDTDAPIGLQPKQITLTNGDVYDFEVNAGRLHHVCHRASGVVEACFDYDERGLLIGATDAAGYRMGYAYDNKRRLVGLDYNGEHCTAYQYDFQNRVIGVATDTDYYRDYFEYGEPNAQGVRAVSFINTLGHRTGVHIDGDDQVIAVIEPQGRITRYSYNDQGDIASETNPLGGEVSREWDKLSNLLKTTYPDGSVEEFERDDDGRLLGFTDQGGAQWQYERDDRGNITAEHSPDGRCWRYQLNSCGQATRIYNPDGSIVTLAYNSQHRLSQWTDALGATTTFVYNTRGNLTTRTYPDGTATHFDYDRMGRLVAATLANGSISQWRWSARGDLIQAIDGEGKSTQRQYGPYGLLQAITDPSGGTVHFEYDQLLRLTDVINENNERYRYDYDANGSITTETDFSGRQLLYRYNNAGQLIEKTAGDNVKISYRYNPMGQLIRQEVFEKGQHEEPALTRFTYDIRGQITAAQNNDATIEFERDGLGRIVCETINGRAIESNYNALGELESNNFDGRLAHYQYDANGLINSLRVGEHAPIEFERDVMGRERMRRSGEGFTEQRQWNQIGQLASQVAGQGGQWNEHLNEGLTHSNPYHFSRNSTHTSEIPKTVSGDVGAARSYHYDKAFNPTVINDSRWGSTHYQYNANNQITNASYQHQQSGLIQERFDYDNTRNIAASVQHEKGTSMSLLKEPPITTTQNNVKRSLGGRIERRGDTTYAYDAQGRMISKRTEKNGFRPEKWHYHWNGEDQLHRVTTPDNATWEYHYDPFGRRINKTCIRSGQKGHYHNRKSPEQVKYLWSGNVLSEERRIYADGTEQTLAYHYEQDSFTPIAQEVDGELNYIVTDHLGTPKELLSEQGEVRWHTRHQLWGKTVQLKTTSRSAANDDCHLRFQGQLEDEETGLYYNRFRYYDPESGDYLSQDPIGLAGGSRLHGYVATPTSFVDEFGLTGGRGNGNSRTGTGTTAGGMNRVTPEWRSRYGPASMREHHLIPQALTNEPSFNNRLSQLGYDDPQMFIDKQISHIPHGMHADIHNSGYNNDWKSWLRDNPDFTRADLEAQTKSMMRKYNIPKSSRNMTRAYGRNC